MSNGIILGCIADDFTGASDAASFLAKAGMKVVLCDGIPNEIPDNNPDAIVVAMKIRNIHADEAVRQANAACNWLASCGAKHFYFKYCSTFDSFPEGNIGPITDSLMDILGVDKTLLCPSLPVNGRIVRGGHLLVNGVPLHMSGMQNHPITPMWSDYIPELMRRQGKHRCQIVTADKINGEYHTNCGPCYIIPDYYEDWHADRIVALFGEWKLLTGGSGLLDAWGRYLITGRKTRYLDFRTSAQGKTIILAGSCSAMTRNQIDYWEKKELNSYRIFPSDEPDEIIHVIERMYNEDRTPLLVYSSAAPEEVMKLRENRKDASEKLEQIFAQLATAAIKIGFTKLIVAGGETSGVVTQGLRLTSFAIGESAAPGVPVMMPLSNPALRLVLKSGNFGQRDFFVKTVGLLIGEELHEQ